MLPVNLFGHVQCRPGQTPAPGSAEQGCSCKSACAVRPEGAKRPHLGFGQRPVVGDLLSYSVPAFSIVIGVSVLDLRRWWEAAPTHRCAFLWRCQRDRMMNCASCDRPSLPGPDFLRAVKPFSQSCARFLQPALFCS